MAPRLPRVLVIDDCAALGRTIARVLRHHDVTCVSNVRSALALLVAQGVRYDAILCDLHMPGMNGEDFYEALSAALPEEAKRVIFMTGDALATTPFLVNIANKCLEKPFSSETLRAAIAVADRDDTALAS